MPFRNQCKQFAEPSITLDKTPTKVVTEAKFLGELFARALSYDNHVNYLKTNSGYFMCSGPHRLGGRSENYSAFI